MKFTKSTFIINGYQVDPLPPVPSYAFDHQGVTLHVFKHHGSWIVGEPITGLTISTYVTCTTRQQAIDETFKMIEAKGGISVVHRAIAQNRPERMTA